MSYVHVVDDKERLLVIRGSGTGSLEETTDSARRAIGSIGVEVPVDYGVLIMVDDLEWTPTGADLRLIAQLIGFLRRELHGGIAIVAEKVGKVTPVHLVAAYSDGLGGAVRAFTNESAARTWLAERRAT
jgi:hypothetical protein